MTEKRITTFQAGIIFSTSVVLFLGFALLNPFEDFYVTGVTVEVIALLLPALAGLMIFRKSFRLNLKLKPPGWINSLMVVFITLFSLPVTLALSALNLWLVESVFGESRIPEVPIPETVPQLLLSLAVVALVPAVCEEILNRGIFQSAFEKFGKWPCVLMGSVLFTLFHFSFEKLLGIFFLSVVIGYVVYVTKSIFIGMIAHFVNNAAAMVISYAATRIGGSEW
ncbi:MAG: CPBP family intramembrane glutamic endopeptidase, partial [Clostridia bacterium]